MQIVLAITLIEDKPQDIVHSLEGISSLRKARKYVLFVPEQNLNIDQ